MLAIVAVVIEDGSCNMVRVTSMNKTVGYVADECAVLLCIASATLEMGRVA